MSDADFGVIDILIKLNDVSSQLAIIETSIKDTKPSWLPAFVGFASAGAALLVGWWNRQSARTQVKAMKETIKLQAETSERVAIITAHDRLIAEKRIEWVEMLRKAASQFNGHMAALINIAIEQAISGNTRDISQNLSNLSETRFYFLLLLNQNEKLHQEASEAIEEYYLVYTSYPDNKKLSSATPEDRRKMQDEAIQKYRNSRERFQDAVKHILKSEWDRTKSREQLKSDKLSSLTE